MVHFFFSNGMCQALSLKLPFPPLHCPCQLVPDGFVGASVAVKSQCKAAGMKLEITSCLLRKLHLIIYLYTSFYFPFAQGTTLGVEQDLKYVFAPGNGVFFLFFLFLFSLVPW